MIAESAVTGRSENGGPSMDTSHVSALELKHAGIERQIEEELSRPLPDDVVLQRLKKRKLKIKEQLARL
jgi:hypothetical protein